MTNNDGVQVADTMKTTLVRDLALAAQEVTVYLRHRRAAEERRRSWKVGVILFFTTMVLSAAITRVVSNHYAPPRHKPTIEIMKVGMCLPTAWL